MNKFYMQFVTCVSLCVWNWKPNIQIETYIHILWVPYMHPVPIFHNNLKIENFDLTLAYSFFGNVMNEWPFVTLEGYIPVKKISIRPPSRWNHSNIRFKILKFAFSLKVFSVFNMWSWNKTLREDNNVNALTQHLIVANLFKDTYVPIMPFIEFTRKL